MFRLHLPSVKKTILFFFILLASRAFSQSDPDAIFKSNIHTVRFHLTGKQLSMPICQLNAQNQLELDFDDMDADVKNYYYTFVLCDYNWQLVDLSPFDYTNGFTQNRIPNYDISSVAYTRYTHYQTTLPDPTSMPTKSGNYLLKVFLDGDTSQVVFTRRMLVVDPRASIAAAIVQPFSADKMNTGQRVKFTVNINGLSTFNSGQDVKVVILQNHRWDNAMGNVQPTFIRGDVLDYDLEDNFVFPGGNEWRQIDLRDLHFQSDRIKKVDYKKDSTDMYVRNDGDMASQKYIYYGDLDGEYAIQTTESINPYTQGDYATLHFTYVTPDYSPYADKDVYLWGRLTDYKLNEGTKMQFDTTKKAYVGTAFLKEGYYNYGYMLVDKNNPAVHTAIDGDHWETENNYTILVYYKSFTDQSDELIGVAKLSSLIGKTAGVRIQF